MENSLKSLSQQLSRRLRGHFAILMLLVVSLQRLLWFGGSGALLGGDLIPSLNPVQYIGSRFSSWDEINLGVLTVDQPHAFSPQHLFEALGQLTGLGLANSQRLLVVFLYLISGATVYYVWPKLFATSNWRVGAFFAALAYVSSPFLIADGIDTAINFLPSYALIPSTLLVFLKGVEKKSLQYVVLLSFLSPFVFSDFPSYHLVIFVSFTLLTFGLFYAKSVHALKFALTFLSASGALSFAINSWWLIPFWHNLGSYTATLSTVPVYIGANGFSSIAEVFRFLGNWTLYTTYQGTGFLPYSRAYTSDPLSIGLSYAPILLAFAALLVRPRNRFVVFSCIVILIVLFLAKGENPPFGMSYDYLLASLAPFRTFRVSWFLTQLAVLPASLLVGVTVKSILDRSTRGLPRIRTHEFHLFSKKFLPSVTAIFCIAIIVGASWPLVTGEIAYNPFFHSQDGVTIPSYYHDLIDWIGNARATGGDFKVLELPLRGQYAAYNWNYQGGNFLARSLPGIVIAAGGEYISSRQSEWTMNVLNASFYGASPVFTKVLSLLGIRYVILERDFDVAFYSLPSIQTDQLLLEGQQNLSYVRSFGAIQLYENRLYSSEIFIPPRVAYLSGTLDTPSGIVWEDQNFSGWKVQVTSATTLQAQTGLLDITLGSEGTYTAGSVIKLLPSGLTSSYLLVRFRTNGQSSMATEIITANGSYYPAPVNPPTPGQSVSTEWYTEAFEIQRTLGTPEYLRIWISNYFNPSYSGKLELWLSSVRIADFIGTPIDVIRVLENATQASPTSFILGNESLNVEAKLGHILYNQTSKILSITKESATSYDVVVSLQGPTLIVFTESFSPDWEILASGATVVNHFTVNGFANGWIVDGKGAISIRIDFISQAYGSYGSVVSIVSIILAVAFLVAFRTRFLRTRQSFKQPFGNLNHNSKGSLTAKQE